MVAAEAGRAVASAPAIIGGRGHPETVTAPPEAANGAAAELERGGLVVDAIGDPGRPQQAEVVLVAERGAELGALTQAGTGLAGVGVGDGQAHGEQAARDEGRGADLAGERECFAGQRDRAERVAGKHAGRPGDGELNGGVRQVAAGPRETGRLFGQAAASSNAPVVIAMFWRVAQRVSSTRQSGASRRALASAARRQNSSAPVTSARNERALR